MPSHDPQGFASGFSAKLATRSRHVCAFLGAGIARACGLPDVKELQKIVLDGLAGTQKSAFNKQLEGRNLEQALSRLRRLAALLAGTSQALDDLTAEQAKALDAAVCQAIVKALSIDGKDLRPVEQFAAWVARTNYHLPVELFTINYDLLLETALENLRVRYFDGFIGTVRARFHTELVETPPGPSEEMPASFARLWKLHGSVNWSWGDKQKIVRLGQPVDASSVAAIYPSDTKYEESRRVPFVVLQDRLRRALHQPETFVVISGYSFGDDHLNELIFDAATRRERSEFAVFCHSKIPDVLAERAMTTPNLQVLSPKEAILGGVRAEWKAPEDASPTIWKDGSFALSDFKNLSAYLALTATTEPDHDPLLRKILEDAAGKPASKTAVKANG